MKKPYVTHEMAYSKMQEKGIDSWDQFASSYEDPERQIDESLERFLHAALAEPWAPKGGRALELGCGTGPLSRWLNDRGFTGRGFDVSATAAAMANSMSEGRDLVFAQADVCDPELELHGPYDLVLDGHCLHCILTDEDRGRFFANARRALDPGGVLLIATMCGPLEPALLLEQFPSQRYVDSLLYSPFPDAPDYEGMLVIDDTAMIPTRRIEHWQDQLLEVAEHGFEARLIQVRTPTADDPTGDIFIAATMQ